MPDTKKHLRLIMPPGIGHAVRSLALKEGRSESAMAVRLIGVGLDAMRTAERNPDDDIRRLVAVLTKAIAEPADAA
jgi:hypothetical protein